MSLSSQYSDGIHEEHCYSAPIQSSSTQDRICPSDQFMNENKEFVTSNQSCEFYDGVHTTTLYRNQIFDKSPAPDPDDNVGAFEEISIHRDRILSECDPKPCHTTDGIRHDVFLSSAGIPKSSAMPSDIITYNQTEDLSEHRIDPSMGRMQVQYGPLSSCIVDNEDMHDSTAPYTSCSDALGDCCAEGNLKSCAAFLPSAPLSYGNDPSTSSDRTQTIMFPRHDQVCVGYDTPDDIDISSNLHAVPFSVLSTSYQELAVPMAKEQGDTSIDHHADNNTAGMPACISGYDYDVETGHEYCSTKEVVCTKKMSLSPGKIDMVSMTSDADTALLSSRKPECMQFPSSPISIRETGICCKGPGNDEGTFESHISERTDSPETDSAILNDEHSPEVNCPSIAQQNTCYTPREGSNDAQSNLEADSAQGFYCQICRTLCLTISDLKRHIKKIHTLRQFSALSIHFQEVRCSICKLNYFMCLYCCRSYFSIKRIVQHFESHQMSRFVKCDLCKTKYFVSGKWHLFSHYIEPCCNICQSKKTTSLEQADEQSLHESSDSSECDDSASVQSDDVHSPNILFNGIMLDEVEDWDPVVLLRKLSPDVEICQRVTVKYVNGNIEVIERMDKLEDSLSKVSCSSAMQGVVHVPRKNVKCQYCGWLFPQENKYLAHIESSHGYQIDHPDKQYRCHKCPAKFAYRKGLQAHVRGHYMKPIRCDDCKKIFFQDHTYRLHRCIKR